MLTQPSIRGSPVGDTNNGRRVCTPTLTKTTVFEQHAHLQQVVQDVREARPRATHGHRWRWSSSALAVESVGFAMPMCLLAERGRRPKRRPLGGAVRQRQEGTKDRKTTAVALSRNDGVGFRSLTCDGDAGFFFVPSYERWWSIPWNVRG